MTKRRSVTAYRNAADFLTSISFNLISSTEELYQSNQVVFSCRHGHTTTLCRQSFNNKRDRYKNSPHEFCYTCLRVKDLSIKKPARTKVILEIFKSYSHVFISLHDDLKQIEYQCGNCGSDGITNFGAISRSGYTGKCRHCQNDTRRASFDQVRLSVENIGFELMMNADEYKTNKDITIGCSKCHIKHEHRALHDLKRRLIKHYHCLNCGDGVSGKFITLVPDSELCYRCYCYANPDKEKPFRFNYKLKENVFVEYFKDYMKTAHVSVDFQEPVYDKQISNSCSKRRPDVLVDCYTHVIILELDENQHTGYSCETKRLCEIYEDLGQRPIVFLRLNPDSYTDESGKHKSCFIYTKTGQIKTNAKEWKNRCQKIFSTTIYHMHHIPTKSIQIELFFFST